MMTIVLLIHRHKNYNRRILQSIIEFQYTFLRQYVIRTPSYSKAYNQRKEFVVTTSVGIDKRYGSEEILRNYCQGRNIRVTFVRYFDKPYKRTASAQLNVVADDGVIISNPDFWPAGIFTKPWLSRQQFISEHSNYQNGR